MFKTELCSLRLLLVDDFPGGHTYVHICRHCRKEYGQEFTAYHHPTVETPNEPIPVVSPQVCSRCSSWRNVCESQMDALRAGGMAVACA